MKKLLLMAVLGGCSAFAETIVVPAGEVRTVSPDQAFAAGELVKEGEGTLDLTGAKLPAAGLKICAGAVKFAAGGAAPVRARHIRFRVSETRPAPKGPPTYGQSGAQFSEFRLFLKGQRLTLPKGAHSPRDNGGREGANKALDGDLKTKCYQSMPFEVDLGEEVAFDGYSFATGNDAIGRDPYSWTLEAGFEAPNGVRLWVTVGGEKAYEAPKARSADVGKVFAASQADVIPVGYPVTIGAKGRLILKGAQEALENVSGEGLIQMEDRARVEIMCGATFSGSVAGCGTVSWQR